VSPILVRPVREQLEHDRVIRLLQQDLQKRKVEVAINPGSEQNASVGSGVRKEFPDAVVYSLEKGKKVVAVVEVETGESVNHLEAMAQWAHLAKLRVPFHLYVPINSVDAARRLSHDYKIAVTEIWSYHQVGEQFKFTLFHPPGASRGGKGATPPRTVSVATIRVSLPPEPEPAMVEEAPVRIEAPTPSRPASRGAGVKTIPARVVTAAPTPAKPAAKAPAQVPRVVPVKAPSKAAAVPAPGAPAKARVAKSIPEKAKPAVAVGAKPPVAVKSALRPVKTPAAKVAPVKAPPKSAPKPVTKPASKAASKPAAKPAKHATPRKGRPVAKAASARPLKVAKPGARNAVKPAAKRK
jgi:hypothetical protein